MLLMNHSFVTVRINYNYMYNNQHNWMQVQFEYFVNHFISFLFPYYYYLKTEYEIKTLNKNPNGYSILYKSFVCTMYVKTIMLIVVILKPYIF